MSKYERDGKPLTSLRIVQSMLYPLWIFFYERAVVADGSFADKIEILDKRDPRAEGQVEGQVE